MYQIDGADAYANLMTGIKKRTYRFPTKNEGVGPGGRLLPTIQPTFHLTPGAKIFTIGSCFAREIEHRLLGAGFDVPVKTFQTRLDEFPHPGPHLLNEYNSGTILQRIESVYGGFAYADHMGIEEVKGGYLDLFLHIHQKPVPLVRLLERRREIEQVYQHLKDANVLVITLGLVETWFDNLNGCYLNKAPSKASIKANPGQFSFRRMDVDDVVERMSTCIDLVNANSRKKILLTVSPVPIEATFTGSNAILANSYSKSVLRVAAQMLIEKFDNVQYLPSYEIATSGGAHSFLDDNVHVTGETVDVIMKYLFDNFLATNSQREEGRTHREFTYIDAEATTRIESTPNVI